MTRRRPAAHTALSLGGYYAPRAAAVDGRFACRISWGPEWDYHTKWQQRLARIERGETLSLSMPWQHLLWVFGVQTKEEAFSKLEGFKLDGVIQKMRCPYGIKLRQGRGGDIIRPKESQRCKPFFCPDEIHGAMAGAMLIDSVLPFENTLKAVRALVERYQDRHRVQDCTASAGSHHAVNSPPTAIRASIY